MLAGLIFWLFCSIYLQKKQDNQKPSVTAYTCVSANAYVWRVCRKGQSYSQEKHRCKEPGCIRLGSWPTPLPTSTPHQHHFELPRYSPSPGGCASLGREKEQSDVFPFEAAAPLLFCMQRGRVGDFALHLAPTTQDEGWPKVWLHSLSKVMCGLCSRWVGWSETPHLDSGDWCCQFLHYENWSVIFCFTAHFWLHSDRFKYFPLKKHPYIFRKLYFLTSF